MGSGLVGALSLKALSRLSYRDARYLETLYDFAPSFYRIACEILGISIRKRRHLRWR